MSVDFSTAQIESFFALYKITHDTEEWYYTGADHTISFGGHSYIPAPIKHGEFTKESEITPFTLDITMPISELAQKYIVAAPPMKIFITIYLYQEAETPQYFEAFQGEVTKISLGQNGACVATLSEYSIMTTKQPRYLIKPACNNILFDSKCSLLKNDWKVSAVISAFFDEDPTGRYPVSATFELFPNNYFRQGTMQFGNDYRHISYHNGSQISLQIGFPNLKVGDTVFVYPGCDKEPATCRDKFDNLENYLGCPYVPRKNPVLYGL